MFAGMLGGMEWVVILLAVLHLFGAKRIPDLAKGLGTGIREFKKAAREVTDEVTNPPETPTQKAPPANTTPQGGKPATPETKVV